MSAPFTNTPMTERSVRVYPIIRPDNPIPGVMGIDESDLLGVAGRCTTPLQTNIRRREHRGMFLHLSSLPFRWGARYRFALPSTKEGILSIREKRSALFARVSGASGKINSRQNDARTENGKH